MGCKALITTNTTKLGYNLLPDNYTVGKSHTQVLFKVDHLGLSTYVSRFNNFDATLSFDPNNI
jgi:polyisoprenoid-binding protein YceI